jgi:hypothetical protein
MGVTAMGRTGRPAAAAIRERFDISSTVYLQRPSSLIDREAAVTYRPMLVRRFRRLCAPRHKQRSARRQGGFS